MVETPVALSTSEIVPVRAPDVEGVNVTLKVHVPFTATVVQLLEEAKSVAPEVTEAPVKVIGAVPLLVIVTVCAAEVVATC